MALENGETTKYVIRVTSQSGARTTDYMLVLERMGYVAGIDYLITTLPRPTLSDSNAVLVSTLEQGENGVYTQVINETDTSIDIDVKALDSNALVSMTLPYYVQSNVDYRTRSAVSEYNTVANNGDDTGRVYLDTRIKTIYIPITIRVPWVTAPATDQYAAFAEEIYNYTLKLERRNLNVGDIDVYVDDMENPLTDPISIDDEKNIIVYETIVVNKDDVDIMVTASGKNAMVSGDYASVGAPLPIPAQHTTKFEKKAWALTDELTVYEFKARAEDAEEDEYTTVYLNVYKQSDDATLKSLEVTYTQNGQKGTLEAANTHDNVYEVWISSTAAEEIVDIKATANSVGALVQIDSDEAVRHVASETDVTVPTPLLTKNVNITASDGVTSSDYVLKINLVDLELENVL
jgi:hypothetical protein